MTYGISTRSTPTPEEAAAITAALAAVSDSGPGTDDYKDLKRQRWLLSGLMGSVPPRRLGLDGSLWSYSSWKGMA